MNDFLYLVNTLLLDDLLITPWPILKFRVFRQCCKETGERWEWAWEANSKYMTSMISMGSKTFFLLSLLHAKKCFENVLMAGYWHC